MSISTLPLCYCTNVHPGRSLAEVEAGLEEYAAPIAREVAAPLSIGLWFANGVSQELAGSADSIKRLQDRLLANELTCHTLNAFPYGDFHGERVKEQVYLPNWTTRERLDYTTRCATLLAEFLPDGREGSVSTMPLGFNGAIQTSSFMSECVANLIAAARKLDELHSETGRIVRLAIEPEPFCLIELTENVIGLFALIRERAAQEGCRDVVDQHIGLCYDVCHQAVEFEGIAESIANLRQNDIRINKVQISCAIALENPRTNAEGREALSQFVEPRYLHQTFSRHANGKVHRVPDLSQELCLSPPEAFLDADEWRIHFHVPVNETRLGPLATTRPQLEAALAAIANLDYAPHLEIETYTWSVLPGQDRPSIVEGIAREVTATQTLLESLPER